MIAQRTLLSFALFTLLMAGFLSGSPNPQVEAAGQVACRFGINVAAWNNLDYENKSVAAFDLPPLGVGAYLDWGHQRSATVPASISYLNILSVSDDNYAYTLASLPNLLLNDPGSLWIVGNEPDDNTTEQDDITAEKYAERFLALATTIRSADPSAKIGFGTIVMPTILRVMYLQKAWDHMVALKGSAAAVSALIDLWTPHGFLLNEEAPSPGNPNPGGAGIPLGMEAEAHHQEVINYTQMNDVELFKVRLTRFRQFMADIGEQNKPLWLTEWGILAPSQQPPGAPSTYFSIPEAITAKYFVDTVNWMETATDPALGLPSDGSRLLQKWFWYSLNDPLYHFGGTLVDPLTLKTTLIGSTFTNYEPPAGSEPEVEPDMEAVSIVSILPVARNGANRNLVDYRVDVRLRNNAVQNHLTDAYIYIYDNSTGKRLGIVGEAKASRCGGDGFGAVFGVTLSPGLHTLKVVVNPASGTDTNPANNQKIIQVNVQGIPKELFAPVIRK